MHKVGDELSVMITDNLFWETMKFPNMVKKEPGNFYWIAGNKAETLKSHLVSKGLLINSIAINL